MWYSSSSITASSKSVVGYRSSIGLLAKQNKNYDIFHTASILWGSFLQ